MYINVLDRSFPFSILKESKFSLNTAAIAGVFGSDVIVSAMGTVHFDPKLKWFGWYNSPGSYQIAVQYGRLATSTFFRSVFPGRRKEPAELFDLDGCKGPSFKGVYSGSVMSQTGHLAALVDKECLDMKGKNIPGRRVSPLDVTIIRLCSDVLQEKDIDGEHSNSRLFALIPILVSVLTCIACALQNDWYSFSMILIGLIASGVSCAVLGCGTLKFTHPEPAPGCPAGDGILDSDKSIVLLLGAEGAVNSVTRGKFKLHFDKSTLCNLPISFHPHYFPIGACSLLLLFQFLAQLLLVPQGTLFGQMMFVLSLAVSWIYNMHLSSVDKEKKQWTALRTQVLGKPSMKKFTFHTRTSIAMFVLLVLRERILQQSPTPGQTSPTPIPSGSVTPSGQTTKPEGILRAQDESALRETLNYLLPNVTPVWTTWKDTIMAQFQNQQLVLDDASYMDPQLPCISNNKGCQALLESLYSDAQVAYKAFSENFGELREGLHCEKQS